MSLPDQFCYIMHDCDYDCLQLLIVHSSLYIQTLDQLNPFSIKLGSIVNCNITGMTKFRGSALILRVSRSITHMVPLIQFEVDLT